MWLPPNSHQLVDQVMWLCSLVINNNNEILQYSDDKQYLNPIIIIISEGTDEWILSLHCYHKVLDSFYLTAQLPWTSTLRVNLVNRTSESPSYTLVHLGLQIFLSVGYEITMIGIKEVTDENHKSFCYFSKTTNIGKLSCCTATDIEIGIALCKGLQDNNSKEAQYYSSQHHPLVVH